MGEENLLERKIKESVR